MARKEDVRNTFWSDLDEVLSNDALLLYIWSFTNERCSASGIYPCPRRLLLEGRLEPDALDVALAECEAAGKLRYEAGVLWSVTRVKHLGWKTPNAAKSIANDLAQLDPDNPIRIEFLARYDGFPWGKDGKGSLTLGDGLPMGSATHTDGLANGSGTHAEAASQSEIDADAETVGDGLPNPSPTDAGNGYGNCKGKGSGKRSQAAVRLSESLPPELAEALPAVEEILGRISEARQLPFAERDRTAAAIASYPDVDHVAAAEDFEDWSCRGTGRSAALSDVVQSYRSQLEVRQRKAGGAKRPAGGGKPSAELAEYDRAMEPAA